ncbi:hypothetical protein FYJ27_06325 [Anaerosalibacter bizertensis]|uniref:WD40 repeat domain-containing protein n=1 Tax=Anaerosalibacter bizertensis TaxID=932217 RepID=A0A844FH74_9FIRM|nr:hypothetical protein [Anaerosalibacter bizertensis]MSS43349.1 hypothetical protein [Anaerosalibacter bizertensis]
MKKKIIFIIAVVLLVIPIFIIKNYRKESSKNKDNIVEEVWYGEKKVAYLREVEGNYILEIDDVVNKKKGNIEGIGGYLHNINWSPDGNYLTVDGGIEATSTTYIISVKDLELFDKIFTTGNTVWSPDSKKLLIGVENKEENIDLAIYYLWSQRAEPLLEAKEGYDYYPEYWKDDNVGCAKVSGENKESFQIKYKPSLEEKIMSIAMNKKEIDSKELKTIISKLPEIDLENLEKIYGEGSDIKILNWLSKQSIKDKEDIESILKISLNLYDEQHTIISNLMKDLYLKDKITFIKALAKVPKAMEETAYAFKTFELYETGNEDMIKDLDMFSSSNVLTEEEKKLAVEFLNIYDLCGI